MLLLRGDWDRLCPPAWQQAIVYCAVARALAGAVACRPLRAAGTSDITPRPQPTDGLANPTMFNGAISGLLGLNFRFFQTICRRSETVVGAWHGLPFGHRAVARTVDWLACFVHDPETQRTIVRDSVGSLRPRFFACRSSPLC